MAKLGLYLTATRKTQEPVPETLSRHEPGQYLAVSMEPPMLTTSLFLFCANALPQGPDAATQLQATPGHTQTKPTAIAPCELELQSDAAPKVVEVAAIELSVPCSTDLLLNTDPITNRTFDPVLQTTGQHHYYAGVELGMSSFSNSDIKDIGNSADVSFDSGFMINGSFGYYYSKNIRFEGTLGYRTGDVDKLSLDGASQGGPGDMNILALMGNAYYDVDLGSPVRPYIGLGMGMGLVELNTSASSASTSFSVDDIAPTLLWNLMVGISYKVNEKIDVDFGYRYLGGIDASLKTNFADTTLPTGGISISSTGDTDVPVESNEIFLGMRYSF